MATDRDQPGGQPDISNVIYVGGATDEALERFLDGTPKSDPRQAVLIDSPDLDAPVSKDGPATFQFHLASEAKRRPGSHSTPAGASRSTWQRGWHEVLQFLTPERVAHAHGAPYNGIAYYLVFTGADSKPVLQVFTPQTAFTPEAVDWQHLTEAPQPLSLRISSAFFDENSIPADGGPFIGGTFTFRIE